MKKNQNELTWNEKIQYFKQKIQRKNSPVDWITEKTTDACELDLMKRESPQKAEIKKVKMENSVKQQG